MFKLQERCIRPCHGMGCFLPLQKELQAQPGKSGNHGKDGNTFRDILCSGLKIRNIVCSFISAQVRLYIDRFKYT